MEGEGRRRKKGEELMPESVETVQSHLLTRRTAMAREEKEIEREHFASFLFLRNTAGIRLVFWSFSVARKEIVQYCHFPLMEYIY